MRNSPDPSVHRTRQQQIIEHVDRLLDDDRLRLDTVNGRRPVPTMGRRIEKADQEVELKRLMSEMGKPDRSLQEKMPTDQSLTVTLWRTSWWFFKKNVGRLKVLCVSPRRALIAGQSPAPMSVGELRQLIGKPGADTEEIPTTVVVVSTSGFDLEAHEIAQRTANRTVILVEPNDSGGWTSTGPVEIKPLVDLFDPESDDSKRQRLAEELEAHKDELLTGSLVADRLSESTQLPLQLVESELKSYAAKNPGLTAKRLEGRIVLYREGVGPSISAPRLGNGGSDMPFVQRLKDLFRFFHKADSPEKKVAVLSEQRALLTQQRDGAYDELGTLEKKEKELRDQFKDSDSELAKRRLTGQILQLRKDLERRQQYVRVLDQQITVVNTNLHSLTLVKQGKVAQMPSSEQVAEDAAAAEEVLADLQASAELAGSVSSVAAGPTDEEQALFEELERESAVKAEPAKTEPAKMEPAKVAAKSEPAAAAPAPAAPEKRRGEAEPG